MSDATIKPHPVRQTRPNADCARAILARLTKDVHARVHRQSSFERLMSETLGMREYRRLLCRLFGFHTAFETALRFASNPVSDIDPADREKAPMLSSDLIAMGMSWREVEMIELCPHLPPVQSQDEIVGALYVVEGAGLGGKVIARKLNYLLGEDAVAGRRFFLGRPAPDPLPWTKFCTILERQAKTGRMETIAESALQSFEAFELWMNDGGCLV